MLNMRKEVINVISTKDRESAGLGLIINKL